MNIEKSPCETCAHRATCKSEATCSTWNNWFRLYWRALRKKYLKGRKQK